MNNVMYEKYLIIEKCFLIFIKNQRFDLALIKNILEENDLTYKGFLIYAKKFYENYKDTEIVRNIQALFFNETKIGLIDTKKLNDLASKYYMSSNGLKLFLNNYMINVLGYDEEKIKEFKKNFKCFYEFIEQKNKNNHINNVLKYYERFAREIEKEQLKNIALEILEEALELDSKGGDVNNYLKNRGLSLDGLYFLITKCYRGNKTVLSKLARLGKKYFDLYESCNFDFRLFNNNIKALHKQYARINMWIDLYINYILGIRKEDILGPIRSQKNLKIDDKTRNLVEILKTKDKEQIILLFNKYQYSSLDIQRFAYIVNFKLTREEQNKIDDNLRKKYSYYVSYKNSHKKKSTERKPNEIPTEIKSDVKLLYQDLANSIREGIDGRSFDLIDFYMNYSQINPYFNFYQLGLKLEDNIILKAFFQKFRVASFINKESIINSHIEVNALKDEAGMPIKGTGRYLAKEEIKDIIDFMEENNVPLLDAVFNVAIRRYQNGTLFKNTLQR